MSRDLVFVAGSPSPTSRSSCVAGVIAARAREEGLGVRSFSIRDFDPADVFYARADAPAVVAFVEAVKTSAAIVLSSPVYKATYAGGLKAIVDLIPPDALVERPALGIATTRLPAHGPEVTTAYRALFAFFRAQVIEPLVLLDEELAIADGAGSFGAAAKERVDRAAGALVRAVGRG